MLAEVASAKGPIVFGGDLIPRYPLGPCSHHHGLRSVSERLIDEKEELLEDLYQRGGRLFFTHDPNVALAQIAKDDRGRFGTTDTKTELVGDFDIGLIPSPV